MLCCKIQLRQGDKLVICSIYRNPNSDRENNSLLLHLFKTLSDSKTSHLLILGDFNYRNIDWLQRTSRSGACKDTLIFSEKKTYEDLHRHVTDWTRKRTGEVQVRNPLVKSDHALLLFTFICYAESTDHQTRYLYNKGDYELMKEELKKSGLNNIGAETDIQHL